MSIIKILEDNISSRIAAGEVIERPASIVKELVENSIDAGATSISVAIKEGGIESIRVSDNGTGISHDDLPLSVIKHATSKIYTIKDLDGIYTMGFRGEALSSIASVSMLTIKSKTKAEEIGNTLTCLGGKDVKISAAGLPDGTTVLVEKIFFNTPARLKFLKKPPFEAAQISNVIAMMIIAHPEISFKYYSGDKLIYNSPGDGKLVNAISCIEGNEIRHHLIKIQGELYGIQLNGYIGKPEIAYKKNSGRIYINTRPIKSEFITACVIRAYGERLLKGLSPFFVLNIKMNAEDIDVNVHPNKMQIHFKDEASVSYLVQAAIGEALETGSTTPVVNINAAENEKKREVSNTAENSYVKNENSAEENADADKTEEEKQRIDKLVSEVMNMSRNNTGTLFFAQNSPENKTVFKSAENTEASFEQPKIINEIVSYNIVGSVFGGFIMVESGETLYIIDQHAAHERMIYDSLRKDMENGVPVQPLLVSDAVRLSHEEYNAITSNIEKLKNMGFDIEPFGALTIKVNAVPIYVDGVGIGFLMHELANELVYSGNSIEDRILPEKIANAACKRAVKGTWKLTDDAVNSLVKDIIQSNRIPTCPHGRPVAIAITKTQLEKSFKRRL